MENREPYTMPVTAWHLLAAPPIEDPDPAVLLELGRVTWAAVHLEAFTDRMCSLIGPANPRSDRRTIGRKIDDAQKVLTSWPATPARDAASTWLARARDAVYRRNATLHAVPMTWFLEGEAPRPILGEMPYRDRPYVERPITTESLVELRNLLAEPLKDWLPVLAGVRREMRQRSRQR